MKGDFNKDIWWGGSSGSFWGASSRSGSLGSSFVGSETDLIIDVIFGLKNLILSEINEKNGIIDENK